MAEPSSVPDYATPTKVVKNDQIAGITNGAAVALTVNTALAGYVGAICLVEGGAVRLREDGTAPTTTVGDPYQVGDQFLIWGGDNLSNAKFIATTATSATVDIDWLRL